ncbi:MAG: OmpA family protein [Pseudomonadota bacterium]
MRGLHLGLVGLTVALLAACGSAPRKDLNLEKLQSDYDLLRGNAEVSEFAVLELQSVSRLMNQLAAATRAEDRAHLAYLAERRMDIARAVASAGAARAEVAQLEREKDRILLAASLREAERARAEAERLRLENLARDEEAARAREEARQALANSAEAERSADLARQEAEQARMLAESQAREADLARQEAEVASAAAESLRRQLNNLQARETTRGLMFTLGDVLFENAESTLKPASLANLDRLVGFIDQYPQRMVSIEGHTDSVGSETFNLQLSQERADAVRNALIDKGLSPRRMQAVGLGEAFPVADNANEPGRRQNRRVEIIILNPESEAAGETSDNQG